MFSRLKLSFIIFKETLFRRLYYWKKSKYFIEWDYTSILLAERAVIERMLKTYKNTDEMSKYILDRFITIHRVFGLEFELCLGIDERFPVSRVQDLNPY